jgi:glutathione S-transferase
MSAPAPAAAAAPLRLITIRFSHFCEKARWALDRAGVSYREESHVPIFSWRASISAGGRRTVPCLVTPDGALGDSTDILRWVDRQGGPPPLFPDGPEAAQVAALEEDFDRHLGPASRRLVYFFLGQHPDILRSLLVSAGSGWEAKLGHTLFPVLRTMIVRGLRIDAAGVDRSRKALEQTVAAVDARLSDGRPYLCGDRFTAADLTFAALLFPLILPEQIAGALPPRAQPDALTAITAPYRASPAGRFALRLYEQHRGLAPALRAA